LHFLQVSPINRPLQTNCISDGQKDAPTLPNNNANMPTHLPKKYF